METKGRKTRIALISVISNSSLVLVKTAVGLAIGSVSILSEAIHSGIDLLASFIALFSVRMADRPSDRSHPFGHGKVENISGTVEALLIFVAAGWILFEAVKKLISPEPLENVSWGVGIMLLSALLNLIVSHYLFKVGKETDSIALVADAWHLRTDVWTSIGVMFGLAVLWVGQLAAPGLNLNWIDPIGAIFVALLILRAAYVLTRQSARDLMDASLPPGEVQWIRECIASFHPQVNGFHHLRTRKAGAYRFVEFHIVVEPEASVEDSHDVSEELNRLIEEQFPKTSVLVHIEPCDGKCSPVCTDGCLLEPMERKSRNDTYLKLRV